ncbi:unnamed protein product [Adineta steineri]|uniref:Uncharacterized protein n=2 Tax=Adineta steineri TaxID=433720 RepID=A0A814ZJW6_9BILA|nr:unnamed protein product [Adineta steineri]
MEHNISKQIAQANRSSLKQNWSTSILREEIAILNESITGHRQAPTYVTDTETQREYQNPTIKRIEYLKQTEQNLYGRFAHTPNRTPPSGIIPTYNTKKYPDVIPRFHLPKIP